MARFNFSCETCGCILEAHREQCGSQGRCPTCSSVFSIPSLDPQTGLPRIHPHLTKGTDPIPVHAYAAAGGKAPVIVGREDGSKAIECPRCKSVSVIEADACTTCGFPFTLEGASRAAESYLDGFAAASLSVSLFGVPMCACSEVGALVSLTGCALGLIALSRISNSYRVRGGRRLAISGIVLACVGLALVLWQII